MSDLEHATAVFAAAAELANECRSSNLVSILRSGRDSFDVPVKAFLLRACLDRTVNRTDVGGVTASLMEAENLV